jgi:hypothetical protein
VTSAPIDLLFGGMIKLGPGDDGYTRRALRSLPRSDFEVVVDAGCGAGRQTLVLAKELGTLVHAVDSHRPFLNHLEQQAKAAGVGHLVRTHCLDMQDIPSVFRRVDLLWSEGAAYSIGFANALVTWATVVDPGDFAVVSELSWLRKTPPDGVHEFFESAYPEMQTIQKNVRIARASGYELLETLTLPREAWVEGYYAILGPRAKALLDHPDESVRQFASEMITEIEVFGQSEDSYGYVLYVLQRT